MSKPEPMIEAVVLRGYGYPHKMPTANIDHEGQLPLGVHTGLCFVVETVYGNPDVEVELGKCLIWSYPNTRIAEVFISGFDGDLYNKTIVIYDIKSLSREHLTRMTEAGMSAVLVE